MTLAQRRRSGAAFLGRRVAWGCLLALGCLAGGRLNAAERIVTIGDSWAWLIANGAPGSAINAPGYGNAMQQMLNTYHPGVTVANESFMGGTASQHAAQLADITARVNAHPDADIVWLSSGGNDLLLGLAGGGFYVGNPNNGAVFAAMAQNVQTVVNHILSIRPNIQVVIEGYDYLNMWDTIPGGGANDTLRLNLGLVRADTGNPALNQILNIQQNEALNNGFKQAEVGKQAIADASRRVHHITNWGLNNSLLGYSGLLGTVPGQGYYPPEIWPQLPTPLSQMGTSDPIHLNTSGYLNLANRAQSQFFNTAFQAANLSLSTGTLDFGNVLVGQSGQQSVTASNVGPNFTKVQNLSFPAPAGPFGGGSQSFNPLFQDPTLGSDTATKSYSFAPTTRSASSQMLSVTSDSGNRSLTLTGRGVAPVNAVSVTPAGPTRIGTQGTATLQINNLGDGNLSGLGGVSNLHGTAGSAAGVFSGSGGSIDLADGAGTSLSYAFQPTQHGSASSPLSVAFTNGSSAGTNAAQTVVATLSGTGVGPVFAASSAALDFGPQEIGQMATLPLSLLNDSLDNDGGNASLTNLTLLSASISGPDADWFSLSGFTPGTVLGRGSSLGLSVDFTATGPVGAKQATLTFVTDQGAALGATGQSFSIPLAGLSASSVEQVLAVASLDNRLAYQFDLAGNGQVVADAADGLFSPIGAAYDAAGQLYVADALRSKIFRFDSGGNSSTFADVADGLIGPTGLALDAGGSLYVANYLGDSVLKISPAGVASLFADSSDGLMGPFDLAINPEGLLLVADTESRRVLMFDAQGNPSTFADSADGLLTPIGIAIDQAGNVFVADALKSVIFKFDPNGNASTFANLADGLSGPIGMTFDDQGLLYVANYFNDTILRFDPAGNGTLFADSTAGLSGPFDVALGRLGLAPLGGATQQTVPEPASLALALSGGLALLLARSIRRRRRD